MKIVAAAAGLCALLAASAAHAELPEGEGKALVDGVCTACHRTNVIERSLGYTEDDWRALTETMVDLSGAPEMRDTIMRYLATHVPPADRRPASLVDGDTEISITEWVVPTLGQRSRDPVEAPDGSIWWAGQWANLVGRIDPETGEMTEFALPPGSFPHSVNVDEAGNVWYTGNKNGTIGKLDPQTGDIDVFPMPDPAARDPHTAEFDADGILWFTLQQSNMIGRLDPATRDIRLVTLPQPRSRPYGIKIAADGVPFVSCNGRNCLIEVDPQTMALKEIALPEGSTTRRLDIAPDGTIWYVNSALGRLGRYDRASGETREWQSPSGPRAHPYAIVIADGAVWYNESGVRPDALVRFDPRSETFQSWPIPSGSVYGGILRHMRTAANGDLLIHQSGTNRIMRVAIDPAD